MTINIRPASLADIPLLQVFEQGVINAERPLDINLQDNDIHYYDMQALIESPQAHLLVAEINNELIGCGYARLQESKPYHKSDRYAYLGFMYVTPNYRGQGVIQQIISKLKDWAKANHAQELVLEVYHNNSAAIKAYEKLGFTKKLIEMRVNIDA